MPRLLAAERHEASRCDPVPSDNDGKAGRAGRQASLDPELSLDAADHVGLTAATAWSPTLESDDSSRDVDPSLGVVILTTLLTQPTMADYLSRLRGTGIPPENMADNLSVRSVAPHAAGSRSGPPEKATQHGRGLASEGGNH